MRGEKDTSSFKVSAKNLKKQRLEKDIPLIEALLFHQGKVGLGVVKRGKNMLREEDFKRLKANQGFLAEELQKRGIAVRVFDWANELLEAKFENHAEFIFGI